jgi:hypothetical protein
MGKKRKKISAEEAAAEQAAWDERTRMIDDYIANLRKRVEERKAAERESQA